MIPALLNDAKPIATSASKLPVPRAVLILPAKLEAKSKEQILEKSLFENWNLAYLTLQIWKYFS